MRALMCFALLAFAGHACAQSITDKQENYVTYPALPAPTIDGFNWNAQAPESLGAPPGKTASYPTQFVNGDFNVRTGWNVYQSYPYATSNYTGPVDTGFNEGVAYLAGYCINPSGLQTICPNYGSISQAVRVGENMRLSFDWRPGFEQRGVFPTATYIDHPINVTILEAGSNRILMDSFVPQSVSIGNNAKRSEVDLAMFTGLDINVVFSIRSVQYFSQIGNPYSVAWTGASAWVDNVKLINAPTVNFGGSATPGNWYNPYRSGAGWDLRRASNGTFYAIWYAYDQNGQPVWYITGQNTFVNGALNVPLYACRRPGNIASCAIVGGVQLALRNEGKGLMRFDFYDQGVMGTWDGTEYFELLVANGGSYSGHFFTNDNSDPSWGITTLSYTNYQNRLQLLGQIYYYDPAGQPTWSVASQDLANNASMNVNRQTGGLCPTCPGISPAITRTSVGTIRLNFDATGLFGETALSNPIWVRSERRYYKLSN
jgi:hypothetical protein